MGWGNGSTVESLHANPRTWVWLFVPHIRKGPYVVISICRLRAEKGRYSRSQGSVTSQPHLLGELEARKRHCFTKQSSRHLRNDTRDCPLASDCTHIHRNMHTHKRMNFSLRKREEFVLWVTGVFTLTGLVSVFLTSPSYRCYRRHAGYAVRHAFSIRDVRTSGRRGGGSCFLREKRQSQRHAGVFLLTSRKIGMALWWQKARSLTQNWSRVIRLWILEEIHGMRAIPSGNLENKQGLCQ